MIVNMQYPVIVPRRTGSDSDPGFAMVKVTSPIEVADYSLDDTAVRTAAVIHHGAGSTTYRRVGDFLFKEVTYMAATALEAGNGMGNALASRDEGFDFGSFMRLIWQEALQLSGDPGYGSVSYLDRPLSSAERRKGHYTAEYKAFMKAPELRNQPWLTSDFSVPLDDWRKRFADFMSNVAIVDGTVHVRCFEPCLKMRLERGTRYLSIGKLSYMEPILGCGRRFSPAGVPPMGKGHDELRESCFSLLELEHARTVAQVFGAGAEYTGHPALDFTVVDETALSPDFLHEETYRLAVATLQAADSFANELASCHAPRSEEGRRVAGRLDEIASAEKRLTSLVEPGSVTADPELEQATVALLGLMNTKGYGVFHTAHTAGKIADLTAAVSVLEARRDAAPITLNPGVIGSPAA